MSYSQKKKENKITKNQNERKYQRPLMNLYYKLL